MRERALGSPDPLPSDPYITVTITPGNYTSNTIGAAITTAMATAGLAGAYTVSFSSSTNKITLSSSNRQFDILFTNNQDDLLCTFPLGFDGYTQTNFINISSATPPNAIALGGPSFIFIRGTLGVGSGDNLVVCDDGTIKDMGNILAAIPVNAVPGASITWTNPAPRGGTFGVNADSIREATFWLTSGDDDNILELNGQPFQFKLGVMVKTKDDTIYGNQSGYGGRSMMSGPRYFRP